MEIDKAQLRCFIGVKQVVATQNIFFFWQAKKVEDTCKQQPFHPNHLKIARYFFGILCKNFTIYKRSEA